MWTRDSPFLTQPQLAEQAKHEFLLVKRKHFLAVRDEDSDIKRARPLNFPELDQALANWVLHCQARRIFLDGNMVRAKGARLQDKLEIADDEKIAFSNVWLQSFQKSHGFKSFRVHGESGSVNMATIDEQIKRLRAVIQQYAVADVYNFDETGLFYKLCPDKIIARQLFEGAKKSKTQITVALACNADGSDMREPLFIGHANKPRYRNNKKAWMTAVLYREWLVAFDQEMVAVGRKALLLIDNASSHIISAMDLGEVTVEYLPSNTTSKLQPLDAGIIAALKRRYRHRQLQHALDKEEEGVCDKDIYAIDQLLVMKWVKCRWRDIKGELVLNCVWHTKLIAR
ncbi:CENPB protein Homeodomainlike, partial [Phytophthora megakarya]